MKTHQLENIFIVNLDDFQSKVLDASQRNPVLVDLWAEWCSPCRVIAPILEKIAAEFNDLSIAKVEVDEDENMKLAGRYQVRGFPTLILFVNGEEVGRFSGAKPLSFIRDFIEQHSEL
ncbi:Thioredoxin [hydrothermal vent metagenome]|uniref:Thioredoxin n=1 Tax=hydrothermal vent metagenome TaxID=652676 RepID=A0A3B0X957_9ZZZZ